MGSATVKNGQCHCIALRRANKAVTDYYDDRLRRCGVTINQFALMRNLEMLDNPSVSELAQKMRLERSTLVRTLRPLTDFGLIEDGAAAGARNRRLRLTKRGRKVLRTGAALWEAAQRGFEEKLGAENLAAWHSLLGALRHIGEDG